jgi:t-SNARE complex subunit (syntaxin)
MKEKQTEMLNNTSPNTRFRKLDIEDENEDSKWYVEFNRLLHSKKCIHAYIILIIISVLIFMYSIAAYFLELSNIV